MYSPKVNNASNQEMMDFIKEQKVMQPKLEENYSKLTELSSQAKVTVASYKEIIDMIRERKINQVEIDEVEMKEIESKLLEIYSQLDKNQEEFAIQKSILDKNKEELAIQNSTLKALTNPKPTRVSSDQPLKRGSQAKSIVGYTITCKICKSIFLSVHQFTKHTKIQHNGQTDFQIIATREQSKKNTKLCQIGVKSTNLCSCVFCGIVYNVNSSEHFDNCTYFQKFVDSTRHFTFSCKLCRSTRFKYESQTFREITQHFYEKHSGVLHNIRCDGEKDVSKRKNSKLIDIEIPISLEPPKPNLQNLAATKNQTSSPSKLPAKDSKTEPKNTENAVKDSKVESKRSEKVVEEYNIDEILQYLGEDVPEPKAKSGSKSGQVQKQKKKKPKRKGNIIENNSESIAPSIPESIEKLSIGSTPTNDSILEEQERVALQKPSLDPLIGNNHENNVSNDNRQEPEQECSICYHPRTKTFLLYPCGHATFCEVCANRILEELMKCPTCQRPIQGTCPVFH